MPPPASLLIYLREDVGSAASVLLASLKSSESELDELKKLIAEFSLLFAPPPPPSLFSSCPVATGSTFVTTVAICYAAWFAASGLSGLLASPTAMSEGKVVYCY